jgi:hypothetical protein
VVFLVGLVTSVAQVHTASGQHARVLRPWEAWAREHDLDPGEIPAALGRQQLEAALVKLMGDKPAKIRLPWT